jgi:GH3 auxin-responsive promoter
VALAIPTAKQTPIGVGPAGSTRLYTNTTVIPEAFLTRARHALQRQRTLCWEAAATRAAADAVFDDLLAQAEDTFFGRKHLLAGVRTRADWKKAIPIRSYPEFQPYIDKILDGDSAVLTASYPYAFLKTSGSSGKPKLIPTTRHWRDRYRGRGLYAQWGLYFAAVGFEQARGTSVLDLSWERSMPSPPGERPVYPISQRPAAVSTLDWLPPWYDESWFHAIQDEDYPGGLYRKLRLLAGSDVRILVSINPSKTINLAEVLAERAEDLIADLRDGTLAGAPCADGADRALADRLQAVHRRSGSLRLTDLWPRLSVSVTWNSASAALYRPWLEEAVPGVRKLPFSATGTEAIVTIPVDGHPSAGPLAVDLGMYEFVPVAGREEDSQIEPDAESLEYWQLEPGQAYSVVTSQANGLYRYDLGDRYTVVDFVGAAPRLEFVGRTGFGGSFTGEKLTEDDVYTAVLNALGDAWRTRPVFSCFPIWATPPGYTVAIEWPTGLGTWHAAALATRIEAELQRLNIEYAEKRRTLRLRPVRVQPVRHGAFRRAEEQRCRAGAPSAQLKHHWIHRNADLLDQLATAGVDSAGAAT